MVEIACVRLRVPLDPHEQSDLAQDAIIATWARLSRFDGRSSFEGWLWGFVFNTARNRMRERLAQRALTGSKGATPLDELSGSVETRRLDREHLDICLGRIDVDAADAIRLKHFGSLTFPEIARRRGVPENTVKARYYRGLEALRMIVGTQRHERKQIG